MALTKLKTSGIADDAVTTDKLANAINTERTANTAKVSLEDNAVTLAKMAGGTDGQIITYDASGDPVAVGPGTDGQVLTSTGAGSPPAFEDASGTTINNNADNRVITGSGTANTLEGESSLTYDGSDLNISNDVPQLLLTDTNSNNSYGRVRGNGGNLILSADHGGATADSVILAEIDGSEKVRIDSAGSFMVGTTTSRTAEFSHPDGFSVRGDVTGQVQSTVTDETCMLINRDGTDGQMIGFRKDGTGIGEIGVAGSSIYVQFGNTSSAAHQLDDYEEGTWTPGWDRSGSSVSSVSYQYSTGTYTKVGRLVTIWFDFQITANGNSGSGVPYISSLPFTAQIGSGGGNNYGGYGAPTFRDTTIVDNNLRLYGASAYISSSVIYMYAYNSSGSQVASSPNASGRCTGQATYFAA